MTGSGRIPFRNLFLIVPLTGRNSHARCGYRMFTGSAHRLYDQIGGWQGTAWVATPATGRVVDARALSSGRDGNPPTPDSLRGILLVRHYARDTGRQLMDRGASGL